MQKINSDSSFILDAIRGISAQMVLFGHVLSIYGFYSKGSKIPVIQNLGVLIFFILSGLLIINSILNKHAEYRFKEYFIDRFSRIYIAFVPALIFVWVIDSIFSNLASIELFESQRSLTGFLGNLLMFQNHPLNLFSSYGIQPFGTGRPFWTVAVEWWIYMFVGFVLIYLKRKNLFTFKNILLLGFLLIVPMFNIIGRGNGLMISWLFGGFLVILTSIDLKNTLKSYSLYFILLVCVICWGLRTYGTNSLNQYDLGISFFVTIGILSLSKLAAANSWSSKINKYVKGFFLTIANYSYSLYLIHYTIVVVLFEVLPKHYSVSIRIFIIVFVSNLLAWGFYYLTERHTNTFKRMLKRKFL